MLSPKKIEWPWQTIHFYLLHLINLVNCQCQRKHDFFFWGKYLFVQSFGNGQSCTNQDCQLLLYQSIVRGIQYFLSLVVFCGFMYNRDLCHLGIVNYTFHLSKDKIQYWYDHSFAHRTSLYNQTLIHCRFNMSRKLDKTPRKFRGICWLDIILL